MEEETWYFCMIALFFFLGVSIGVLATLTYPELIKTLEKKPVTDICENKPLQESVQCIMNYVGRYYKYNMSNMDEDLTDEQLLSEGGVCKNWAEFYKKKFSGLGFYAENFIFDADDRTRHMVTIVSNQNGYCLVDMLNRYCVSFDLSYGASQE